MGKDTNIWISNNNIMDGLYPIDGAYREEPMKQGDTGWRVISVGDTPEYLNNPMNVMAVEYEEILAIEPELARIQNLPVGSEVKLLWDENGNVSFVEYDSGTPLNV